MEIYQIKNLSFTYPQAESAAISEIDITIKSGEFITICGQSGCGKSTLLRQLKPILTPHGIKSGRILFRGEIIDSIDQRIQVSEIGFVQQSQENQIVTDKVWHELAFGLESLGFDNKEIRLRVAETASFFGIQDWFLKDVAELSGGEKQLLNLASVMTMQPSVLVLDEPTSQLDPIAASHFLETIKKINQELGITVILTEHRLEEVFPMSDRVIVMDRGKIIADSTPQKTGETLKALNHPLFHAMPSAMRIYSEVVSSLTSPITVCDGRKWLDSIFEGKTILPINVTLNNQGEEHLSIIDLKEVWFRYDRNMSDIIKGLSLKIQAGQLFCIVGGNGTGKTTTLSIISGIQTPYRGKVRIEGNRKIGALPQNPQSLFVKKTLELDLQEMLEDIKISSEQKREKLEEVVSLCELGGLLKRHPYDLSGGEQQRAALAKVLLLEPEILLLDEPTKGLDGHFKLKFAEILKKLKDKGVTIVLVSHDIEFCASYGDVCAMFFDGGIVTQNNAKDFFAGNSFYTTAANRMARHLFPKAVTTEDVIEECKRNL